MASVHFKKHFYKQSSLNSYRFSFFVNGIFLWNSVPHDIFIGLTLDESCITFYNTFFPLASYSI